MSFKKKYSLLASTATIGLILAACGADTDPDADPNGAADDTEDQVDDIAETDPDEEADIPEFPETVENEGDPIDGGTLHVGLVSDTAFPGIFNTEFSSINVDSQLYGFSNGELVSQDENFQYGDQGAATVDVDEDTDVVTITLEDDVLWHDGEQVTADDILFTHEVLGDPDYDGPRYSEDIASIIGMSEYKDGEADEIEGIDVVDDLTIEIEYESVGPQMLQAGGGVWAYASPRHHLGHLEVSEIESSPEVREDPIGFGPFEVTNIVEGESVEYEAFDDYFLGEPNIDNVIVERIPPSGVVEALRDSQFDFVYNMPVDNYAAWEDGFEGYEVLGTTGQSYDYLGFKMGTYEDGENVIDEDAKMSDLNLRQAMAHALDIDAVGENFHDGLYFRGDSHIIPNFEDYYNDELEGYPYDPETANELLDEAGYEYGDDGFRETPEGEELVITYAARAGSEVAEPIALYFIQAWEEIGLNVELLEGRLHEANAFYDRVENDDPEIDVYEGGWSTGSDPTPDGLYGPTALFNYPRYVSDENTEYMEDMLSQEGFDMDWRVDVFHEWQEYFLYEAAATIPTFWRTELQPVNDRVSDHSHFMIPGADVDVYGLHEIELLADDPL